MLRYLRDRKLVQILEKKAQLILYPPRCYVDDRISKVAWLNRSNIIFAGNDKWSLDPRVTLLTSARLEYSLQIQQVDISDEGPYTCSVQTQHHPKTYQVHLIVQVPPKIYNISSNITVNEGSNVTLVCLANGRPEPVINWRHISPSEGEHLPSKINPDISIIIQSGFLSLFIKQQLLLPLGPYPKNKLS
ncbi:hypothetical protein chiPu_0004115 [Chiloscyllium punctatum]|uniref:Ig-like domain-containing protein n=1 Tax=Chiloscyllium punctatum TaxID=137246 RepID=A0A401S5M9_CHIPU|nr:hypothetical protein [Chiloscyllium punctatum]